jgi:hypothetical protein
VEMGARYHAGRGVPMDLAQAVKWYKEAAIQYNGDGETALGYALMTGGGTPQDLKSALAYFWAASGQNGYARFALAGYYADGVIVERDPTEAYKWCLLALEIDRQAAGLAQTLKSQLTPNQIAEAVKGVADFHRQRTVGDFQTDDLSIVFTGDSTVTMPFEYVLQNILIPVQIDQQKTEYLLVDTGSSLTELNDGITSGLKIKANKYISAGGTGADIVLTRLASGIDFSLPGLTISGATADVLPDFDFDQYVGHPLAGILGYDILRHLVVTIDYVNKKITFQKPGTFKPDPKSDAIPLSDKGVRPFVQAKIGSEAAAKKGWFLLDTGDGGTMTITLVFQEANPQVKIDQPVKSAGIGSGGISYSLDGKCPRLILGTVVVSNPIATFDTQKQGGMQNVMGGYLGEGIQERFDETFDSPDGMLYLKPNARFSDPFTYNNVGMGVKTAKGDYHSFLVFGVVADSPAALSNVQVGDQIVSVDKVAAATMSLGNLHDVIVREGIHRLGIVRAGVSKEIDLNVVKTIK